MSANFEIHADAYEAMIDWPKRLANETPLLKWIVDRIGARRALDAACGTGHHAHLLHTWGLEVEGADLSAAMVARCRQRWGESDGLRWRVRGFDQPIVPPEQFDLAICVGNSLALPGDLQSATRAVKELLAGVRPGGALLIHVLNLWRLPDGPCAWQKCVRALLPGSGDSLIVKGVHRAGGRGYVDVIVTALSTPPRQQAESVPFLGLRAEQLQAMARDAGARSLATYGDYQRGEYDPNSSQDLILLALK